MSYNKEKARWARILRVYGLTKEDYDVLDLGRCPLCLRPWSNRIRPCVDHDHKSGYVRGILCSYCNRYILGRLNDPVLAHRIYKYLKTQALKHKIPKASAKRRRKKKRV